jgi:hypothetical protein
MFNDKVGQQGFHLHTKKTKPPISSYIIIIIGNPTLAWMKDRYV